MTRKCIWSVNIPEESPFLAALKVLKSKPSCYPIVITEEEMRIEFFSPNPILFRLNPLKLLEYTVDKQYFNKPEIGSHVVFLNLSLLRDQIGSVTKRSGIRMWQFAGSEKIHLRGYSPNGESGRGTIKTENQDYIPLDLSGFENLKYPSCKVTLYSFVAEMKQLLKIKITKAQMITTDRTIHFSAVGNSGCSDKAINWPYDEDFGDVQEDCEFAHKQEVSKDIVNLFSKLGSLGTAIVRIYAEQGTKVVRFVVDVGNFAELFIFVSPTQEA